MRLPISTPCLVALLALVAVVAAPTTVAVATPPPPPPPAAYYGSLAVNGEPAPAGVTVTARIDGEVRGRLTTERAGAYGGPGAFDPKLQVDGTDADDGRTVRFFVGGVEAATTAAWRSADVRQVALSVSGNVTLPAAGAGGGGGAGAGGGGGQPSLEDDGEPRVTVRSAGNGSASVRVDDARAGQPVEVDVPGGDDGNVSVDGLTVTTTRNTSFDLDIAASGEPPAGAPALDTGTDAVGYLRVDHDVPDADVGEVTFRFRVRASRLAERGVAPADVVLFRHHDGAWQTLETRPAGETATHHVFEAVSPGLSVFAIGVRQRADVAVVEAALSTGGAVAGETVTVTATVENRGRADGTATVELRIDGAAVAEQSVVVPAGGSATVSFDRHFEDAGTYEVRVGDVPAGSLVVSAGRADDATTTTRPPAGTETETGPGDAGETGGDDNGDGGPGTTLLLGGVVVAVIAAVAAVRLRRRGGGSDPL